MPMPRILRELGDIPFPHPPLDPPRERTTSAFGRSMYTAAGFCLPPGSRLMLSGHQSASSLNQTPFGFLKKISRSSSICGLKHSASLSKHQNIRQSTPHHSCAANHHQPLCHLESSSFRNMFTIPGNLVYGAFTIQVSSWQGSTVKLPPYVHTTLMLSRQGWK